MRLWTRAAVMLLICIQAPAAIQPESFTVNGLKVIVATNPATDVVAANVYFRGGVAVTGIERAGLERLALIAATRATTNYPRERLNAALERMNTRLGASAGPDYASITMQCVKQNLGESWKILADVVLNPAFDSTVVERERERTIAGIRQVRDNPDAYLAQLAGQEFYRGLPYSVDPAGTETSVAQFTGKELQAFMRSRVTAAHMLIVVCGNVTRSEVEQLVRGSFSRLPQGSFTPVKLAPVTHQAPAVTVVKRALPTTYIMGMFPMPPFGTPENYALTMGRAILADRLFEEVRTKRSLSYAPGVRAGTAFSNYSAIYVTAVKPETTVAVMVGELKRLQTEPVNAKTLNDRKNLFFTGYYLGMETSASQADNFARYELSGRGYEEATRLTENIRKVTAADVQKVANEYIHNLQFVLIGDPPSLQLAPFMF